MPERVHIVVPGDDPPQIAGSPQLERLRSYGEVTVYRDRPRSFEEKIERVGRAQVIINSRGIVTWRERELRALPGLRLIATCSIGTDMIDLPVAGSPFAALSSSNALTSSSVSSSSMTTGPM